ncbi:hypothetical protein NLM16_36500 [Bradyrhizobium brasilense]|uniref:hypothetical protein n=1 Tax=Bradyrhizobium brasilense TaxID=1419277 RepID=UPI002877793A|nr:hypothetical protein [Bradyrhizobium brasilense]MCP3419620.1 hypothetical protein [Bradyrhizobium brasilense]
MLASHIPGRSWSHRLTSGLRSAQMELLENNPIPTSYRRRSDENQLSMRLIRQNAAFFAKPRRCAAGLGEINYLGGKRNNGTSFSSPRHLLGAGAEKMILSPAALSCP